MTGVGSGRAWERLVPSRKTRSVHINALTPYREILYRRDARDARPRAESVLHRDPISDFIKNRVLHVSTFIIYIIYIAYYN